MSKTDAKQLGMPDTKLNVRQVFGIDTNMEVMGYAKSDDHVPDLDPDYLFNRDVKIGRAHV